MAVVCPRCQEGSVLPGEPTGNTVPEFQGAYFSPAPDQQTEGAETGGRNKCAVLLLTDAFGLPLKNCKIMADELAKRLGCDVWVPDYFNGKSFAYFSLCPDVNTGAPGYLMSPLKYREASNALREAVSSSPSRRKGFSVVLDSSDLYRRDSANTNPYQQ